MRNVKFFRKDKDAPKRYEGVWRLADAIAIVRNFEDRKMLISSDIQFFKSSFVHHIYLYILEFWKLPSLDNP